MEHAYVDEEEDSDKGAYEEIDEIDLPKPPQRPPKTIKSPSSEKKHTFKGLFTKKKSAKPKSPPNNGKNIHQPSPIETPVNPSAEVTKLIEAIRQDEQVEKCGNCGGPDDRMCTKCQNILCYRCSRTECTICKSGGQTIKDFGEYWEDQKRHYKLWIVGRRNKSVNLEEEIATLSKNIQKKGQELANTPISLVISTADSTISYLKEAVQSVDRLGEEIKQLEKTISYYDAHINKLHKSAFIKLVAFLMTPDPSSSVGTCRKFNLGHHDTMVAATCEYAAQAVDGKHVIASGLVHVELFEATSTKPVGNVQVPGHVGGMQAYKSQLYVVADMNNQGSRICVFDEELRETRKWFSRAKVCDIAVNNDKVYLACLDDRTTTCIQVYSIHGTHLYSIDEWSGHRMRSHPLADIIIIANYNDDLVFALNGETQKVLWTVEMVKPCSITVDEYNMIWVWCECEQNIFVFDSQGNKSQELDHPKFSGIGDVNSICLRDDKLWVAFDGGLYRIDVGFD